MSLILEWLAKIFATVISIELPVFLDWVKSWFKKQEEQSANQAENEALKKKLEDSKTEQEQKDATAALANKLHPPP